MKRLFACLVALLPGLARAGDITVFAAASTAGALDEVAAAYAADTGDGVVISYAGSSALARQIQQGAPADLFISANTAWMDALDADGLLVEGSRVDLLGNSLVLVGRGDPFPLAELPARLGNDRLAMALVDAVPAGIYGKAALESLGLWDALAPRVAQTDNVRAALALVATAEAPMGITYATDAAVAPDLAILATFPADSHPPITYPAAALTAEAAPFLAFLQSDAATAIFTAHGFTVPE